MATLLEKLGMSVPIIQAPMAGVSTPAMAAAVSNSGGLGSIGIGASTVQTAREMIEATMKLTGGPVNVNVFCHRPADSDAEREARWINYMAPQFSRFQVQPPERLREIYTSFLVDEQMFELVKELCPRVVSFHFGIPAPEKITKLKSLGIILFGTATNLDEARLLADSGIDAIVAQGYEAGGHRGIFDLNQSDSCLSTEELVRLLVSKVDIPIIAAGGIMDGAEIIAALQWGAIAAQLGTAFIACAESAADEYYRSALFSDAAHHTVMTKAISGRPARCLSNKFTEIGEACEQSIIPDYPIAYDLGKSLNAAAKQSGEGGYGAQWAGAGAPLARSMPAADLMAQLQQEMSF